MSSRRRSSAGEVPLVVLLVGEQAELREAALAELVERVLGDAPRDFNEDRFDLAAPGFDADRVLVAARTLPVLGERRLVRLRGLEGRRASGFLDGGLLGYLDDPAPTTCLLLEAARVDRRLRWVKRVAEVGEVRRCEGPRRPAEVRDWIEARIRAEGKRAGRGAAGSLFDLVGADLDRLAREVEKVCLYVGDRERVSSEDVAEVTGQLRPRALWELTDAIGGRDLGSALRVLGDLQRQGEAPLAVIGALANHFRRLVRARECRPLEPSEVQRRLALHPFAAKKLVEQARRLEPWRLRRCLDEIRRADDAVKGGAPLAPRLAVERLVLTLGG
jgi:DNA polymerase-3 subunit delta